MNSIASKKDVVSALMRICEESDNFHPCEEQNEIWSKYKLMLDGKSCYIEDSIKNTSGYSVDKTLVTIDIKAYDEYVNVIIISKDYCEANIQNHEWRTILNHLNRIVNR